MNSLTILHTEASLGWGGQEMRILKEALGFKNRGARVLIAANQESQLLIEASSQGLPCFGISLKKNQPFKALKDLIPLLRKEKVSVINTHSSWDAWMGGIAGKLCGIPVVRTRHLSTPIRGGLNSLLLFKALANTVVTTCTETANQIQRQASLIPEKCRCIPTGIEPSDINFSKSSAALFRQKHSIPQDAFLVSTVCIWRSWKGLDTLLDAAARLSHEKSIYWALVGDGPMRPILEKMVKEKGLHQVRLIGFMKDPSVAIHASDLFALLSTAHEGISQASLQASILEKPLITTSTGGLKEVCIEGQTGFIVPNKNAQATSDAILNLFKDREMVGKLGCEAKKRAEKHFLWQHTLDQMEEVFLQVSKHSVTA